NFTPDFTPDFTEPALVEPPPLAQALPTLPSPETEALPPTAPLTPAPLPESVPLEIPASPGPEPPATVNPESVPAPSLTCPPLTKTGERAFPIQVIEVVGNSVLQREIDQQVACYAGQELTLSDLFNLRSSITELYIGAGYITSGAFLPNNQDLGDEAVQIQVVEGSIETIQVNGLTRLSDRYVTDRLARAIESPFNQQALEDGLQLLQIDPALARVNAELTVGSRPGQSLLIVELEEAETFGLSLGSNNYRSPSIGSEGINAGLTVNNPLGFGDRLTVNYGTTNGLSLYDVGYSLPLNSQGGTAQFRISNSDSRIVQDAFRDIGIRSDTTTLSAGIRQPLWRTPSEEFAIGLDFDWKRSQSYILEDIPFSFSAGPEAGLSQVSALRFSQDWVRRSQTRVLAARSQFSLGLDLFDATVNDSGIDGQFFAWVGQFQWIEQFSPRFLLLTRFSAQLTPDALLPVERFSLGGVSTVRGYPQNQIVTDNALTASVEARIPVSKDPTKVQITPFIDVGAGWNTLTPNPNPNVLLGTGVGVRWLVTPNIFVRVDYGIPLISTTDGGGSLQENGLYFLVDYIP
ncbi:MAG: ShlB/FhaC/HecB family hemolysin secretion/activation protein, partial [Cyanobacteria bacterium J06632_22]